jgi:hypothetical protein
MILIEFIFGVLVGAILRDSLLRIVKRGIKTIEDWSKGGE